jgi:hypothetical protein
MEKLHDAHQYWIACFHKHEHLSCLSNLRWRQTGVKDSASLCTSVLRPLNKQHHLHTFPLFMTPSPITSTSWRWISTGRMFCVFKNRITECTSQLAGLVIDMVLYKTLWHSNQFTQWLGKHWGHGRGSDDNSQLSKTSSQWPARAGCANGSYF